MTANDLLKQVPVILRARGFRLYTSASRLIDLWLNGGALVLGHTPPNILREIKNTASRGLYAPFPHFTEGRYLKALAKLFPKHSFRLYAALPPELENTPLWRPFEDPNNPFAIPALDNNDDKRLLVLPGIQTWRNELPLGLCAVAASSEKQLEHLPPNDTFSPILLAAATRAIHDLIAVPQRAKPQLPRTFKALKKETCSWQQQGIYLYQKENPSMEKWSTLFSKFLEAGFLIPPTPIQPLILPGELSEGEDIKFAAELEKTNFFNRDNNPSTTKPCAAS